MNFCSFASSRPFARVVNVKQNVNVIFHLYIAALVSKILEYIFLLLEVNTIMSDNFTYPRALLYWTRAADQGR